MGWLIFIGIIILIGIFLTDGAGVGIAVLLGLGGLGFGIFRIWKYSDDKQWDKLAREKIANAISKANGVELSSTSSQGRKQAKEALETADAAKGLSGYEAYKLAELSLELAEEAVELSKMTDSEISALAAKKAELTVNQSIAGKWETQVRDGGSGVFWEFTSYGTYKAINSGTIASEGRYEVSGNLLTLDKGTSGEIYSSFRLEGDALLLDGPGFYLKRVSH